MKKYIIHLFKNLSIFFIVTNFILWTLSVFALNFPLSTPGSETAWWNNMSSKISNTKYDCWVGKYLQWFLWNWNSSCKIKSNFNSLTSWWSNPNYAMIWSWLYTKYLWKILNDCWNKNYVRWFDSNKNMLCVTKDWIVSTIWTSIVLTPSVIHTFPSSKPDLVEQSWWFYTSNYFNKIFTDCWLNKYLQWYNSAGNVICGDIIIWVCWYGTWPSLYHYPISNHCTKWSYKVIDSVWSDYEYNWNCLWDLWRDALCSVKRKVDWACWSASKNDTRTAPTSNLCSIWASTTVTTYWTYFSRKCNWVNWWNPKTCDSGRTVDWVCWNAVNYSTRTIPTSSLCSSAFGSSSVTTYWTYFSWSCNWINWWISPACTSIRIVDWWWSSRWNCSKSCWWWTQYRTCTNPVPANWWNNCVWSNSKSCNTQACCAGAFDSSWNCCEVAPAGTYCKWVDEYGVSIPGNNPSYKWCDHAGTLHCVWESDYREGVRIDCYCK